MSDSSPRFRGIVPPMVTPLLGGDELDVAGLERLVEHLIAGGVSGIFILGTTGEAPSLSYRLRRELIERSARLIAGRVPMLVGITDTSLVESLDLAGHSADCGAAAVVAAPPYYLPPGQPELREYLDHLAGRTPLPLMLYNMPSLTKLYVDLYAAAVAGDLVRTRDLSMKVLELSNALYTVGHHDSSVIKGLKCALSLSGICDDFMADPFHRFREVERQVVAERLRTLGLLEG